MFSKKSIFLSFALIVLLLAGCGGGGGTDTPNDPNFYQNGEVRTLIHNSANGVNIVFLGDGFIHEDLAKGGDYDTAAEDTINFILDQPPFKYYKNQFNAYIIYAQSQDRGADTTPSQDTQNTVFNASFGCGGVDRLLCVQNTAAVESYLDRFNGTPHLILISVNDTRYGGSGGYYSVASRDSAANFVMLHEAFHSFGGVADEYEDTAIMNNYPLSAVPSLCNVDTTGDTTLVKWKHLIGRTGYSMVGAFQGGYYRPTGIWRPQSDCAMRGLGSSLCNVCREAQVKRIFQITGQTYTLSDFLTQNNPSEGGLPVVRNGKRLTRDEIRNLMFNDYIPH